MDPKRLLSRTKDPISTFHKFVLSIGNNEDNCICFFEGRDSQYYYTRINHFKKNYNPIICGNKMNVIESNKKILRKYPDYNTLFFIDSDFDEKVELPNLYVTCGYSIENFYCSSEVISEILKNEFFLNVTDREYIILMSLFEKLQKEFHKSSELFNLWYFTIKNKAKQLGISCGASLNDKFPKGFLSISLDRVNSTYDLEIIKSKFPNAIDVTQEDLNQNKSLFFTKSPWLLFRGKYEIEFIIKFLNLIIDDANTTKKYLKNKSQFRVDSTLILSQLSQYAITTFELKDFLNSKLN